MSTIETLAIQQLEAYNASDLDAFVACYHEDVVVYDGHEKVCQGTAAFRSRYQKMFETMEFGGEVPSRLVNGTHCVDLEHYWRIDPATGERVEGTILVCYELREGTIGTVRFLRD